MYLDIQQCMVATGAVNFYWEASCGCRFKVDCCMRFKADFNFNVITVYMKDMGLIT